MKYTVKETKSYDRPQADVIASTAQALKALGGKTSKKTKPSKGYFDVNFNKKIKGKYFSNRIQLHVKIAQSSEQSTVSVEAYPVSPIGQKLMFGVKGKPARMVVDTFWAELEAQL
jgi:hypothetical protein